MYKQLLKRLVNHDPRSKNFAFNTTNLKIVDVTHQRLIPILNQLQVGSCTGNAGIGCINTSPFKLNNRFYTPDENGALDLYSDAEKIDGGAGYPPEDQGSSGLSIAKALLKAGLISSYQHTFTLSDALKALTQYPIITGIHWYSDMFTPDADGRVHPTGTLEGGHEIEGYRIDTENGRIWFHNSWGTSWGVNGDFYLTWADYYTLLSQQGDVTVLIPPIMKPTIQPSTIALIAQFEGCSLIPYKDAGGTWTIGYGALNDAQGNPVNESTPAITQDEANNLLTTQLQIYADAVTNTIKTTLNQNQFDACVSLCYNIGVNGFEESTVARQCNAGNYALAAQAFLLWDKIKGVVNQGLLNRRKAEMTLFLK